MRYWDMDKETLFEYIQRLKLAVITLFKWLFCSFVCGCFIGSVGAVFHLMLGYVGSDADLEAIARIMNVTPSSIERIRNGETEPTAQFEERIREVSLYYMQNDQSFSKLQSIVDPEYGWFDSILNFPSHHPWWFWSINIILLLILAFATLIAIWPILLEMLIFLIAWIASLICSPGAMQDSYVDSINPTIEQIK